MIFSNKFTCVFAYLLLVTTFSFAQDEFYADELKQKLVGLKEHQTTAENPAKLDGKGFPAYHINGDKIKPEDISKLFRTFKYSIRFYEDDSGKVMAAVFVPRGKSNKTKFMPTTKTSPPEVSETPPSFTATDIHGKTYALEELKGKVVVLNFWFTACKPCVMEMPELNQLVEKYKEENVVFLGVTFNSKTEVESFLKRKSFSYNIIVDPTIIIQYGIGTFPTNMVINQKGEVAFVDYGYRHDLIKNLNKTLKTLL